MSFSRDFIFGSIAGVILVGVIFSIEIYKYHQNKHSLRRCIKMAEDISVREALKELMQTKILKSIAKRNGTEFTLKLAMWLIRYILVVVSLKEALGIPLEEILENLHGKKYKKVNSITDKIFSHIKDDSEKYGNYIW